MKKVVIIGPESTGKSQLAQELAKTLACDWVPEFARSYLQNLDRPYQFDDLSKIAAGQKKKEDELSFKRNCLLICDTNAEVIKVWSENAYGCCEERILRQISEQYYDLVLLTDIDLPWKEDPQREHPNIADRAYFFSIYKDIALESGVPFGTVSGFGKERIKNALLIIKKYTGIEPVQ